MRVIFLTHNYPRHPGDLPGGFLHPLARELRSAGVDIRVVAPADGGKGGQDVVDDIPVRRVRYAPAAWENLAYTGRMMRALRDPRGALALIGMVGALRRGARREAEEGNPGPVVVHAHWWFPAGLAAPPELPAVITLHGTDGRLLERSTLARALAQRVVRRAAVVTTVSHALAERLASATGLARASIPVQGLPVDATLFRRSSGGGGVVAVARLTPQKRLDLLLGAIGVLRDRGREVRLTIVGGGEELPRLQDLISELRLESLVTLAGPLGIAAVADTLSRADLFALPARAEGYGLAAAEALIAGVPVVVCRDGGGLVEIAELPGAGRIALPTTAGIAEAVATVLDTPGARELAAGAGEALRRQLDPRAAAETALGWYERALRPLP